MKKFIINGVAACFVAIFITCLLLVACNANKKLTQQNAEAAIRQVIEHHTVTDSAKEKFFNLDSIIRINPVTQFSETEASAVVKFKDDWLGPFALRFVFQKNIDNKWVLRSLEPAGPPDGASLEQSGHEYKICQANPNLNVVAQ
jgi:hypothetical protein